MRSATAGENGARREAGATWTGSPNGEHRGHANQRGWLRVECGSHLKLERGATSGSLHRLVRWLACPSSISIEADIRVDLPGGFLYQPRERNKMLMNGRIERLLVE